jgi:hypothetical protein
VVRCDVRLVSEKCVLWAVCVFAFSASLQAQQTATVRFGWDANPEPDIAGYALYYGGQTGRYSTRVNAGNVTTAVVSNLVRGATYYFALAAYNTRGLESDLSAEVVYTVPSQPVNLAPTLDAINSITIAEDAGVQTVALTGVSAGATNESQTLVVTASSSNPSLIAAAGVNYTSPNSTGAVSFQPAVDAWGSSVITVSVDDGQPTNHLVTRSFTVTVNPVNDPPRFDPIADVVLLEGAAPTVVALTGINAGASNESQPLTIGAASSRPDVVPNPTVSYMSPAASGSLTIAPVAGTNGSAVITVTLSDGDAQNGSFTRTFVVTIEDVNDPPTISAIPDQVIAKNRMSEAIPFVIRDVETAADQLKVSVASSDPTLLPLSGITVSGTGADRLLSIDPVNGQTGEATVTVSVTDGASSTSISFNVSVANTP